MTPCKFEFEVDDSEIIIGNGRVDVDHDKWCRIINESRRLVAKNKDLRAKLAATEKNKARLDWLERNGGMSICGKKWFVWHKDMTKSVFNESLRNAIDEAKGGE